MNGEPFTGSNFKSAMTSQPAEKRDKAKAKLRALVTLQRKVDERDRFCCRVCGHHVASTARHHHHVVFRSKGGGDSLTNVILLCAVCHADVHLHKLTIAGNANGNLRFHREQG